MNSHVMHRLITLLISYLLGSILTGEIVSHAVAHKSASELGGSGNPGMANITSHLGIVPGLTVLFGDLLKCGVAMLLAYKLFPEEGRIILFYAGLGASFGHCLPFWRHFEGGKAVATSSLALFVFSPVWGGLSLLIGLILTLVTGYFSLGGVSIPFFFLFPAYMVYGTECFILASILFLLCFFRHYPYGKNFPAGAGKKTYLLRIIAEKLKK